MIPTTLLNTVTVVSRWLTELACGRCGTGSDLFVDKRTYNDSASGIDFGSGVHDALPGSGNSRPNVGEPETDRNEQPPSSAKEHRGSRGYYGSNSSSENYASIE